MILFLKVQILGLKIEPHLHLYHINYIKKIHKLKFIKYLINFPIIKFILRSLI